jgi:hypothetical protein
MIKNWKLFILESSIYPDKIEWINKTPQKWVGTFKTEYFEYEFMLYELSKKIFAYKFCTLVDKNCDTKALKTKNIDNAYTVLPTIRDILYDFTNTYSPNSIIFDTDDVSDERNSIYNNFCDIFIKKYPEYTYNIESNVKISTFTKTIFTIYKKEIDLNYIKQVVLDHFLNR